jgi:hypothetical protein
VKKSGHTNECSKLHTGKRNGQSNRRMFAALTKWLPEAMKMNSNLLIVPGSSIIDLSGAEQVAW